MVLLVFNSVTGHRFKKSSTTLTSDGVSLVVRLLVFTLLLNPAPGDEGEVFSDLLSK